MRSRRSRFFLALTAACAFGHGALAQAAEPAIPNCTDTLVSTLIDRLVDNGPGVATEQRWLEPTAAERQSVTQGTYWLIRATSESTRALARRKFNDAGMDVCRAKNSAGDSARDAYVAYGQDGLFATTSTGLPVLVYQPNVTTQVGSAARLVLSIPHAKTESHLADDLAVVATNISKDENNRRAVRATVISTVHRCHADQVYQGPYSGGVSVEGCGGQMRVSDDAHNEDSLFQAIHQELRRQFWDDYVVQIHGAGSDFGGISVSNGSGDQYWNANSDPVADDRNKAVVRWYDELSGRFAFPADFTSCHRYTAIPNRTRVAGYFNQRRCGTQNATRGEDPRLPQDEAPASPDNRFLHFLHLEVDSELKDEGSERTLLANSLARILRPD